MTTTQLNKEYKKISKRYFQLEEKDIKSFEDQRELNFLEVRMSEIAKLLETN
ncbi:hypothetical protein [Flavobacterium sp. LS1P3]|uniref:hypothetical protein n=1 Tax=Flavobacterium sp. LS1P3 TaxID=3401720 RepID=UPI003AAD41C1